MPAAPGPAPAAAPAGRPSPRRPGSTAPASAAASARTLLWAGLRASRLNVERALSLGGGPLSGKHDPPPRHPLRRRRQRSVRLVRLAVRDFLVLPRRACPRW
ncbi:hypothetical protein FOCC_FOCC001317, partial [Frankliniella occidentalis]